VSNNVKELNIT